MKVADLMETDVRTAPLDWTLADVVQSLADGHVTALPVVDREGKIVGVVSTADVLEAQAESLANETDLWEQKLVEDVMNRPALTITADATLAAAAQQMLYGDVHRLFVEEAGRLVGVISQTDLVRAFAARRV